MSHSFCIITNGNRPELLSMVIRSIQEQAVAAYEIIIAGVYHAEPGIIYIAAEDAAANGRLGEMRNKAVARARYENIVMLDDDIIFAPDWYAAFSAYGKPFDIMTSQIRLPDGGRYYDHVTTGGPKGQTFLDEDEDDEYVYMTGGGGWVMKRHVAESVAWDPDRAFYQEEDVDFSRRCQEQGYKISHNHGMVVYHADPTYTNIGRALKRRKEGRSHEWVLHELDGLTTLQILHRVKQLRALGQSAESADYVRMAILMGKSGWLFTLIWQLFLFRMGGDLPDTSWSPLGSPEYVKWLVTLGARDELPEIQDDRLM
jgi:glycosyltransferase involved in cell wall biosynthesis